MKQRTIICVVLALVVAGAVWAAEGDGYLLRYKFEAGQVLKTIETTTGTIPMDMAVQRPAGMADQGGDAYQGSTTIDVMATRVLTIESVDENGTASGSLKIEYLFVDTNTRIVNQTINQRIEYEDGQLTTSGTTQSQMSPEKMLEMEEMLKRTYHISIDPLGAIEPESEEYDAMWRQVMGKGVMGVNLRELTQATGGLPKERVNIGDTWEQKYTAGDEDEGTTGSSVMELTEVNTIDGCELAVITGTSTFDVQNTDTEPSAAPMMGNFAAGMQTAVQNVQTQTDFEMHMDIDRGQVVRQSADITLGMEQTMVIDLQAMFGGNQPLEITFDMTVEDAKLHSETSTEIVEVQAADEEG
ncbi:MAG: hypothetical protein R6V19_02850 [Armatimonadota bacterium]